MAKLFIYLDEYKMYSLSSQIFEGLTQEVVQYSAKQRGESEQQKGNLGTGKLLADIVTDYQGREERKFLYDFAYTVFERQLLSDRRVAVLEPTSDDEAVGEAGRSSFIKVTGPISFNDLAAVQRTTKEFNKLLGAFSYIGSIDTREASAALLRAQAETAKGQHRTEIQKALKDLYKPEPRTALDETYLQQLNYVLEYGYGDHLEVRVTYERTGAPPRLFTAVLDRSSLREPAPSLVKKYSRRAEQHFTIFGIVTQHSRTPGTGTQPSQETVQGQVLGDGSEVGEHAEGDATASKHLRVVLGELTDQLWNVEDTFVGRLPNEIIIDPIAVYREL